MSTSLKLPGNLRKNLSAESIAEQKQQKDQHTQLNNKNTKDVELLEDVRDFVKKRAHMELEYSKGMKALVATHLAKRNWEELLKDHGENATVISSFKLVLDEAQTLADKHDVVGSTLLNDIAEPIKNQLKTKTLRMKKNLDLHLKMQENFHEQQNEFEKVKKLYETEEKLSQIAENSYNELEKKHLGKKQTSLKIFQGSKAESEKRIKKAYSKMVSCKSKAVRRRNDFLLSCTEINSQLDYYYNNDIPQFLDDMDNDFYSSIKDYCECYGQVQRESADSLQQSVTTMFDFFACIQKEYEEHYFLENNKVFKCETRYEFAPVGTDTQTEVIYDESSSDHLIKESTRLVQARSKAKKKIAQKEKEYESIQSMMAFNRDNNMDSGDPTKDVEAELMEIRFDIIAANWEVARSDAKLEMLRMAGVPIPDEEDVENQPSIGYSHDRQSMIFDEGNMYIVLYDYEPAENDELYIYEDEILTLVAMGDDGWCTCKKEDGSEGLVPLSYIEEYAPVPPPVSHTNSRGSLKFSPTQSSTTSGGPQRPPSTYQSAQAPVRPAAPGSYTGAGSAGPQRPAPPNVIASSTPARPAAAGYAKAVYDYQAEGPDELSFEPGDVIEVISMTTADVNDGWWKGRLNGKVGVFPSILTELEE